MTTHCCMALTTMLQIPLSSSSFSSSFSPSLLPTLFFHKDLLEAMSILIGKPLGYEHTNECIISHCNNGYEGNLRLTSLKIPVNPPLHEQRVFKGLHGLSGMTWWHGALSVNFGGCMPWVRRKLWRQTVPRTSLVTLAKLSSLVWDKPKLGYNSISSM